MLGSSGKKSNLKALERIDRENVWSTDHPSVRYNQEEGIKQSYFIKGSVEATSKYSRTRTGAVKHYDKVYDDVLPFSRTINAVSRKAAIEEYQKMAADQFNKTVTSGTSSSSDPFNDNEQDQGDAAADRGGLDRGMGPVMGGGGGSDSFHDRTIKM